MGGLGHRSTFEGRVTAVAPMWTDIVQALGAIGTLLVAVVGFCFVVRQLTQLETSDQRHDA